MPTKPQPARPTGRTVRQFPGRTNWRRAVTNVRHVGRQATRMWREHGPQNRRAMMGVTCAALLAIMVLVAKPPLGQALAKLDAGTQMVIYLSPFADDARGQQLALQLGGRDGVATSEFVGRDETRQRLLQAFRGNEAVLRELDAATLPASIELRFAPGIADVMPASPLPAELRALPEVAELTFVGRDDHALAPVLAAARLGGNYVGWLGMTLACALGGLMLRFGTVDIRREASVIELLGGPQRMWRVPAILVGGVQGFVGAGFAAVLGYWLFRGAKSAMLAADPALVDAVRLSYLSGWQLAGLLAAFATLGMAVAVFAAGRAVTAEQRVVREEALDAFVGRGRHHQSQRARTGAEEWT